MTQFHRISVSDRSDFAAYLDGELPDNETRRIEGVLAENAVARADLEQLSRTYELLDELPRVNAPKDFAAETVKTARLAEQSTDITQTRWYRTSVEALRLSGWTLALVIAACLGYVATSRWIPQPRDPLVDELPLIDNLDKYQEIHDYAFLERMAGSAILMERVRSEAANE